jgi:hypothetical protein
MEDLASLETALCAAVGAPDLDAGAREHDDAAVIRKRRR